MTVMMVIIMTIMKIIIITVMMGIILTAMRMIMNTVMRIMLMSHHLEPESGGEEYDGTATALQPLL